jgi:hypothetical protein
MCSFTERVVFLDFFEALLPISHASLFIMIFNNLLEMFSGMCIDNQITVFFFGLNSVTLIYNIDGLVYLQIDI